MDLNSIDRLVRLLEKAAVRPGSPPVMEHGKLGVWRTVRGFRMFIELNNGSLGNVIVGPPSFAGKSLDDISDQVWFETTPKGQKSKFKEADATTGGVDTLRSAIKESLGSDDTRHAALKTVNTVEEIVPLARSAGFRDDEIKRALRGNKPQVEGAGGRKPPRVPNRLLPAPEGPKRPDGKVEAPASADDKFNQIIDSFNAPSANRDERAVTIAMDILDQAEKGEGDESMRLRHIGYALASGAISISEARRRVEAIKEGSAGSAPTVKEVNVMHDRYELKQFVDTYEEKIADGYKDKLREAAGSSERAKDLVLLDLLSKLENTAHVEQVKTEIAAVKEGIRSKSLSRGSVIRRILQLLRLLLTLIPG